MISRQDFERGQRGDAVRITYLPGDPSICRSANSIGRERAKGLQRSVFAVFGFIVLYEAVLVYVLRRRALTRAAA